MVREVIVCSRTHKSVRQVLAIVRQGRRAVRQLDIRQVVRQVAFSPY